MTSPWALHNERNEHREKETMSPSKKKPAAANPSRPMGKRKAAHTAPTVATPALSVDELFDRFPKQIMVLFGWFFLEHLGELYRAFKGDMVMPIILGEIAHHNICHEYSRGRRRKEDMGIDQETPTNWDSLEPCNALSLSDATGIPRETCRRKARELCQAGLIARHPKSGYVVCQNVSHSFLDLNRRTLASYLALTKKFDALTASVRR